MDCKGATGMAVTVVRGDKILHKKGYGYADFDSKRRVRDDTRFCVASLTKAFTATLLAMLLDETGHDWDTPISVLMPGMIFPDAYRTQEVSLRDLLSHKVGYPAYDLLWSSQSMSLEEMLRRFRYLEPVRPFRTDFTYSNLMYILAGKIAENLAGGQSWELLVGERILKPLGMDETSFAWEAAVKPEKFARAHGFQPETGIYGPLPDEAMSVISSSGSAASICTTANDMAEWMRFLLNRKGHPKIKYTQLMDEVFKAQTALRENWNDQTFRPGFSPGKYVDYGLGWFTGIYRGYKYHDHYGFILDYYSQLAILPDQQIAVFSTINGADNAPLAVPPYMLNTFIMDRLLNETPYQDERQICEFLPEEHLPHLTDIGTWRYNNIVPVTSYTGLYGHPVFGNVSIYTDLETGELLLKYGRFEYKLESDEGTRKGRFKIRPSEWWAWICASSHDHVQFLSYDDELEASSVAIPCFEMGLADVYFEKNLKLTDIELHGNIQVDLSLKTARIQSGQDRGQIVSSLLMLLLSLLVLTVT